MNLEAKPNVFGFFDEPTSCVQYVAVCRKARRCVVIDPVLEFDPVSASISTAPADRLLAFIREQELGVDWILDTHPHADHLSASAYVKQRTGARMATGAAIMRAHAVWASF
jgi:glyoxylase-like metal-dependent hydrolase (beta-lactamase superfamily II)